MTGKRKRRTSRHFGGVRGRDGKARDDAGKAQSEKSFRNGFCLLLSGFLRRATEPETHAAGNETKKITSTAVQKLKKQQTKTGNRSFILVVSTILKENKKTFATG